MSRTKVLYVINEGGRIGADAVSYPDRIEIRTWLYLFGYGFQFVTSKSRVRRKKS